MTLTEINDTLIKFNQYRELAEKYYTEKTGDKYPTIRIDEYGNIEHEINDACNCHPEYIWKQYTTVDQVVEWSEKQKGN